MLVVVSILQRLRGEAWVGGFVQGLAPAVAVLMVLVAWKVLNSDSGGINWLTGVIAVLSLVALLLKAPAPLVLLGAGIIGIIFSR